MHGLSLADCEAFAARARMVPVLEGRADSVFRKAIEIAFKYPVEKAGAAAQVLVEGLGPFETALVWIRGVIFSDSAPIWQQYRRWLRAQHRDGFDSELGHLFKREEATALTEAVGWTLQLGVDAFIVPMPCRRIVEVSHDDIIILHCDSTPPNLRSLEKLGWKRRR